MSYIFISYSRKNEDYARKLVEKLQEKQIDVWIDDLSIPAGAKWQDVIEQGIKDCAAFVVIMTPDAREAEEVGIELELAKRLGKPRLPLLLEGEIFTRLVLVNCVDVRGGAMPPEDYFTSLAWHVKSQRPDGAGMAEMVGTEETPPTARPLSESDRANAAGQYIAIWHKIVDSFERSVELDSAFQSFLRSYPGYDPDDLADRFLPYQPLTVDLGLKSQIDDSLLIDTEHELWKRLERSGAQPRGNKNTFPAQFGKRIGHITYQIRRAYTESGDRPIGRGYNLYDAIKAGDSHPFWAEVGLPGVPMLWGSAAVVYRVEGGVRELLLGVKQRRTEAEKAVYAGQLTPPAGIVNTEDFETSDDLAETLVNAARRELYEETGLVVDPSYVRELKTYSDIRRCKQQAFVIIEFPPDAYILEEVSQELLKINFYDVSDPESILNYDLSPECKQAIVALSEISL